MGMKKNEFRVDSVSVFLWFRLPSARFFGKAFVKIEFPSGHNSLIYKLKIK